jgi:hypothetical protein
MRPDPRHSPSAVGPSSSRSTTRSSTVRARPAPSSRFGALGLLHSTSVLYGNFVCARRALNSQKRRFPTRADRGQGQARAQAEPPAGGASVALPAAAAGRVATAATVEADRQYAEYLAWRGAAGASQPRGSPAQEAEPVARGPPTAVQALSECLHGPSFSPSESFLCGVFAWARRALNREKRRSPVRADGRGDRGLS